jgi:hypothetical protein
MNSDEAIIILIFVSSISNATVFYFIIQLE